MRVKKLAALCAAVAAMGTVSDASADFVLFGGRPEAFANQAPDSKVVKPISQPYFHEDSFVTTDLRAWYLRHDFGDDFSNLGGTAEVYALQVRVALTDRLQLVAYKDGYIQFDTDVNTGLGGGWNDVAAGLKYQFYQDYKNQLFAAAGVGYEFPVGDSDVFQNNDEWRLWVSVNKGFGPLHLGATLNYFFQDGEGAVGDSQSVSWHVQADYYLGPWFSPVVALHGYHYLDEGSTNTLNGVDVTNFGSGDSEILATVGGEFRPGPDWQNLGIRAAVDVPVRRGGDDNSLYGWRLTFSVVYEF